MPRGLWFKRMFVEPILRGEKTNTFRAKDYGLRAGDVIRLSAGPVPPFAEVRIDGVTRLDARELRPETRAMLGGADKVGRWCYRIDFTLLRAL